MLNISIKNQKAKAKNHNQLNILIQIHQYKLRDKNNGKINCIIN